MIKGARIKIIKITLKRHAVAQGLPQEVARSDDRSDRGWRSDSLRAYNTLHACEMSKEVTETCAIRKALRWEVKDFLDSKRTRERFQDCPWRSGVSFW